RGLRAGLEPARELPAVADVRVLGAIGVVQLEREVDVAAATEAAVGRGVWLRPFRDLVYTMPPYVIDEPDLARVTAAVVEAARAGAASPPAVARGGRARAAAPGQRRQGSSSAASAKASRCGRSTRGRPCTSTSAIRAIVSRLERSRSEGRLGHGVSTTARSSRPAARAAATVSSVWLIVPRPGRAAMSTGSPRASAEAHTV